MTCPIFFHLQRLYRFKSLDGEAHNVAYIVCTSHLVILLLKHPIRGGGRNLLRLSVSRCARVRGPGRTRGERERERGELLLICCQRAKCQHASRAQRRPVVPSLGYSTPREQKKTLPQRVCGSLLLLLHHPGPLSSRPSVIV